MKARLQGSILAAVAALCAASLSARADAPGNHPAYLHALSDLREARANLERPNGASGTWDEKTAVVEIDAAIKEIKDAAIDDGKDLKDHPTVDVKLDWGGRLKHALDLVTAAYSDVHEHGEDNKAVAGLKVRSLKHMSAAAELIKKGLEDAKSGEGGSTGGQHPAYLHALSDLRDARALLERPADLRTAWDEHKAVGEIDAALKEIKDAAIDDGKNLDDHAPVDANLDWGGRLKHAKELLQQAYDDVHKHEDNQFARGLSERALKHISLAAQLVDQGIKAKWQRHR